MTSNIIRLETEFSFPFGGKTGKVCAFLIINGKDVILVDTFVAGKEHVIEEALQKQNLTWQNISSIVITHAHPDHTGSLDAIKEKAPQAKIYAGTADSSEITGAKGVEEGEKLGSMEVIAIPGHTPGSIALFDSTTSSMIIGDAATNIDGKLSGPPPMFTEDMDEGMKSLEKLSKHTFNKAYVGHGEPIVENASFLLAKLVKP